MAEDDGSDTSGAIQQSGLQGAFMPQATATGMAFPAQQTGTAFAATTATPTPAGLINPPAVNTPPTTAAAAPNPGAPATITANPNGTGFEPISPSIAQRGATPAGLINS